MSSVTVDDMMWRDPRVIVCPSCNEPAAGYDVTSVRLGGEDAVMCRSCANALTAKALFAPPDAGSDGSVIFSIDP